MTMATAPAGRRTARRTEWVAQSKSITFAEYGFADVDKSTNEPNVFL